MAGIFKKSGFAMLSLLLLALPAAAQLNFGELSTNLNGTVSAGYNGSYGNQIDSDHSLAFGGTGTLSGFYYNPNFVSFTAEPYINQARDNSAFQSISNASGVNFNSNIFSGSHFPGSISYATAYNSEGNFAIPGVANYTTHGDSNTFGINWGEMLPGVPSLTANFQMGDSQYSIYGSNDNGSSNSRSFSLRSGYTLKGFNMSAFFTDGTGHSEVPEILESGTETETSTYNNLSYGFNANHPLPFHGSFSGGVSSSTYSSAFEGNSSNGTIDNYAAGATFQPTQKLHLSFSTNYSTNLSGSIYEAIAGSGGVAEPVNLGEGTHSLDMLANASYSLAANLQTQAFADHRSEYYLGQSFGSDSYGGGMTYWRLLFGGSFNAAVTLSDNTVSNSSANSLGLSTTVNYNKRWNGWAGSVSFSYAQNVQTQLISYTTSSYSYGANLRRRWGKFGWSGGGSTSRTLLTEVAGSSNDSESFFSAINYSHWITANGNYSKSKGTAIQSGLGLIQDPVPQPVVPADDIILFGGKSYSFGLSSSPVRHLSIGASYAKSISNSDLQGTTSENDTKMINAIFNYQFRKMYITGGYSNLLQGFSLSGTPPENVSSFYIGITRWFNFF